jgi:hypothetical protein
MSEDNREARNAVFAKQSPDKQAGSAIQQTPMKMQEQLNEREINTVPLPSRGLVYPPNHPLHGKDIVEIREMKAKEEDILMNETLLKNGTMINELLRSCLLNKSINVGELISGDRMALMIAIRITGYTDQYKVQVDCPSCSKKHRIVVDLSKFNIKELGCAPGEQVGPNQFQVKLPVTEAIVVYKFLTGSDEDAISQEIDLIKKKGGQPSLITTRLRHSILSVNGNDNRDAVARFIRELPARDSLELRTHIEEVEPGIDLSTWFECTDKECKFEGEIGVPITVSFFYPNIKR